MTLFVGAELKAVSQAGIYGNDDPGIGVELEFGNLQLSAKAYVARESQRLGLENDNDLIDYAFTAVYNARPHRFGVDVVYFRDRFTGADTAVTGFRSGAPFGWTGQKIDSVWIDASWSGRFGPIRALLQGNALLGTANGSTVRGSGSAALPASVFQNVDYDIFAGGGLAYLEVDLGIVRPFIGAVYGTGDGDPTDRRLQGFQAQSVNDSTQVTSTGFFDQLDTSSTFALRDYSCPARSQGLVSHGRRAYRATPMQWASSVLGQGGGTTECSHSTSNVFNSRLGNTSHSGIVTNYSNPGTLVVPVGLKVYPLRGHELAGYGVYRAMVKTDLLEIAFAPELAGRTRGIRKAQYYGLGGNWQWTLNPHFDIRLSGEIAFPGDGYKDIARLSDCDPGAAGCSPVLAMTRR